MYLQLYLHQNYCALFKNMSKLLWDQTSETPVYSGRKTKTGNSEALRFEQALFKSHPEFSDRVVAQVIAPGCLLVIAEPSDETSVVNEEDPVISAFLSFIAKDMPQHITELDSELMDRVDRLVGHIEVDPNEDLGDESLL
jgi:prlF antitoxin for toxin YhaV_toxin